MANMFPFETSKYSAALLSNIEGATGIATSLEYPAKDVKKMPCPFAVAKISCRPSGYAFNAQVFALTATVTITTYNKKIASTQDSCDLMDVAMNELGFEEESRTTVDRNGDNFYFITTRYSKILNQKEVL